jgi:alpha-L-rhamnosidase
MLGPLTWWNFIDWDNFNDWGEAPGAKIGNSAIVTLQLAYTLRQAAELLDAYNYKFQAKEYLLLADSLANNTYKSCYNGSKGLIADTPEQSSYSQHASIWAILSDAIPAKDVKNTVKTLLNDKSIGQVTFFYRFYLTQALKKADMADLYYGELKPWRDMLKLGLTTFAEKPEPTRSDCHAWSASPNYDFLATICGIAPGAPGFQKVIVKPALGELTEVIGSVPTVEGNISVNIKKKGAAGVNANITLPLSLQGVFEWKGKSFPLHGGKQIIMIP